MARCDRWTCVRLIVAGVLVALCPVLRHVFACYHELLFPGYRNVCKAIIGMQAMLASVVPFAVWDVVALVLVIGTVIVIARHVRQHRPLMPLLSVVSFVVAACWFAFAGGWALNHYAPSLAFEIGLTVGQYSTDQLAEATEHYLVRAAELAPQVPRGEDESLTKQDFFELAGIAGGSYAQLENEYALFDGSDVPVKALLVWGVPLLYSGHTGIYWAPTGEAGVPLDCAVADTPFIMCHEAAHRLAIASEQEANFAAFLACSTSDDVRFAYSGYYNAFVYCFNALYRDDPERASQLLQEAAAGELGEGVALVWSDRVATSEHYGAYEGPFEKVGSKVNDTYLKSYGESAGVRSYGLVVDYLIAWYQR